MNDLEELFAETDCVTLLDEYDAVETVTDEENGERSTGEVHLFHDFLLDGTIDVGTPNGGGGEIIELSEVETGGGVCVLEEENEFAAPFLQVFTHKADVTQSVVSGLLVGGDESYGVITATASGEEGGGRLVIMRYTRH